MIDFLAALGLVLVIEGVLSAAFPNWMKHAMASAAKTPPGTMRTVGIVCAVIGVVIVWLVRRT